MKQLRTVKHEKICCTITWYRINSEGCLNQKLVFQELYACTFNHSTSKTILYWNLNCFKMSVNMIKTCHKCSLLVLFYWISGFLKRHTNAQHFFPMDLFSHLAWIFHYFFSFYFHLKKESRPILGNLCYFN